MSTLENIVNLNKDYWVSKLIDKSRRNNLLFLQKDNDNILKIRDGKFDKLGRLLSGGTVKVTDLIESGNHEKLLKIGTALYKKAKSNLEEKGIDTLYFTIGLVQWPAEDGGREYCAPIFLLPIKFEPIPGNEKNFKIIWENEIEFNKSLQVVWLKEYNQDISYLIDEINSISDTISIEFINDLLEKFKVSSFAIKNSVVNNQLLIGNFSFQKISLVNDLENYFSQLSNHDLIAALCGDEIAIENLRELSEDPMMADHLDTIDPEDEHYFLPADSSQATVIRNVVSGRSGVIQGPPGTGKSQTIANLIGEMIAQGKKVLFVSQKRAALDVVKDRLDKAKMGDLILDLHGGETSRKKLVEQLNNGLDYIKEAPTVDYEDIFNDLRKSKEKLRHHCDSLHTKIAPWNKSPYEIYSGIKNIENNYPENCSFNLSLKQLHEIHGEKYVVIREMIEELSGLYTFLYKPQKCIWLVLKTNVSTNLSEIIENVAETLKISKEYHDLYLKICQSYNWANDENIENQRKQISLARKHNELDNVFAESIWGEDLNKLVNNIVPHYNTRFKRALAYLTRSSFRTSLNRIKKSSKNGKIDSITLASLTEANYVQKNWGNAVPKSASDNVEKLSKIEQKLVQLLMDLKLHLNIDQELSTISGLKNILAELIRQQNLAYNAHGYLDKVSRLRENGLDEFVEELIENEIDHNAWVQLFTKAHLNSLKEYVKSTMPSIANFNGITHDKIRANFQIADRKHQNIAAKRIRRIYAERAIKTMNEYKDQTDYIKKQSLKKRPENLRSIIKKAPDVLLSVFPLWMASPLSISQLMGAEKQYFDLVLFDEASQVQLEEAIPSILRGRQVVVAGDIFQLPPTTFFADGDDEENENTNTKNPDINTHGYESLLHAMNGLLPGKEQIENGWFLKWHYRSKDESLIAFSNFHIYKNRMISFPRPFVGDAIEHIYVAPINGYRDSEQESSLGEVLRVRDLILELLEKYPNKSLGVITLGINHNEKIVKATEEALETRPDLSIRFNNSKEPCFIKNLERVQGDERDIIVLSIGYGQDRSGHLSHNFGPINKQGGERRLNVAITRARERMIVVSSFQPEEIDTRKTSMLGPKLLKKYIEYAKSNGRNIGNENPEEVLENPFEESIRKELESHGLILTAQYGVSQYRIDLVVHHPLKPGKYILAIECDGASYHSAPCVRDRDRLRQEHLEALGWCFHRIWSTDWFNYKEREIERALETYHKLLEDEMKVVVDEEGAEEVFDDFVENYTKRPPMPGIGKKDNISKYSLWEIELLILWVQSDKKNRTDEDIVRETFELLPFKKMGSTIKATIETAINRLRSRKEIK